MPRSPHQPESADDKPDAIGLSGDSPGVVDERVSTNLRVARERLGLSQADLAEKMAALGWKFHAQTIYRIEQGQRRVSIGEGVALAHILDTHVDRLGWFQGEDAVVATAEDAIARVRQAWRETSTAVLLLADALAGGRRVVDEARATRYGRAHDTADALEAEIADASIESAVEDGLSRRERIRSGEGDVGTC
jgi:transcriptional regulator with XRE-family HTH domain